ncbi:MAG: M48 family metallopeptidase [Acaryochloris sp. RU_4_1]|nr:M48 family metallopeptidase [Acaryochloris sp. RU_4_1]NJR56461.1 M48 family metallopeptidase [Acaryochloris sp. CRU_2_0]
MRIRGLVKASHKVRDQLKFGIPVNEVPQFKQYIIVSIHATEQICATAKIKPNQLPLPSRKAYQFLKGVDLKNLPILQHSNSLQSQKRISIRQIRPQHQLIQHRIAQIAQLNTNKGQTLIQLLQQTTQEIEDLCDRQQATPANLTGQSRQIYCWLKFLLRDDHLSIHIRAVHQFQALVQHTLAQKKSLNDKIKQLKNINNWTIELTNMSALYRCQLGSDLWAIKINEGFILAASSVMQAIVESLLFGKSPKTTHILNDFSLSEEFAELLLSIELSVDELEETAQGSSYNLDEIFEAVNCTYFSSTLDKPKLCWSRTYSKRKFGHYEPTRDQVVISLNLDAKRVPRYVVEFVMYHELLHKVHGLRTQNGRQRVHSPAFRVDERQFKQYSKAQEYLNHLARAS